MACRAVAPNLYISFTTGKSDRFFKIARLQSREDCHWTTATSHLAALQLTGGGRAVNPDGPPASRTKHHPIPIEHENTYFQLRLA